MLGYSFFGEGAVQAPNYNFYKGVLKYYSITMAVGGWVIMKAGVESLFGP